MSKNTGNTILAILTGAAIGAGVGILFAPDKGSQTRVKIKEGYKDAQKDLEKKYKELSEEVKTKFSSSKVDFEGSYDDLLSSMSHKTEDVITFLESKLAELKQKNARLQK
ncbi:YtxH domain-containing protein [Flavobacterium sp. XN-5]|uniref:YtxH domain-containing protein n=1 Tax=Flavobacterium hiemivividum TaxID=2541734 RepID=A0A4R5CVW6_9FLAO|nr:MULTISPECIES: YtxH domain-containing protein [Flavobacterium]NGY36701.1 YtxH domain-containing protein [Flavobacterium sp. XN-5]TDE04879.1 YtxH domain-containing protein [Flavobacterium hiemivividum]